MLKYKISILLLLPLLVMGTTTISAEAPEMTPEQLFNRDLSIWSDKLGQCESQGNPKAINPKDSDGKPKFGYHQYMPSTFIGFAKKYNIYPEIDVDVAFTYMLDKEKTTHLTMEVMRQNPKEFGHWGKTCRDFAGQPPIFEQYK